MEKSKVKKLPVFVDKAEFWSADNYTVVVSLPSSYGDENFVAVTQNEDDPDEIASTKPESEPEGILALVTTALSVAPPAGKKVAVAFRPAGGDRLNVGQAIVALYMSSSTGRDDSGDSRFGQGTLIVNIEAEAEGAES